MKRTKVVRMDAEFVEVVENGRRMYQAAVGRRVSVPVYTAQLADVLRPLMSLQAKMKANSKR